MWNSSAPPVFSETTRIIHRNYDGVSWFNFFFFNTKVSFSQWTFCRFTVNKTSWTCDSEKKEWKYKNKRDPLRVIQIIIIYACEHMVSYANVEHSSLENYYNNYYILTANIMKFSPFFRPWNSFDTYSVYLSATVLYTGCLTSIWSSRYLPKWFLPSKSVVFSFNRTGKSDSEFYKNFKNFKDFQQKLQLEWNMLTHCNL